jgi:hypothetical protein
MTAKRAGWGGMSTSERSRIRYRICIDGHLDADWSIWFEGMIISQELDGTTTLTGSLVDQAALYGLLSRLRDLGATLRLVERLGADSP